MRALGDGAVALVEEQHVDVAGVVELPTAELPHGDDPEPDVRRGSSSAGNAHLGQSRQLPGHHGKVCSAEQVARRYAQKLSPLPPAQRARAVISRGEERGGGVAVLGEHALVAKPLSSRNGSSSEGSRMTALDSERDAALSATSVSRTSGFVASSSPSAG